MWQTYFQPTSLAETLALLRAQAGQARLVAGGTDLIVELQRGIKPTNAVIDLSAVPELKYIREEQGAICLGALATHNDVIASSLCVEHALPLAQACWEVGAPQIRTRATVAGNLVTASPANDSITPLTALDAALVLNSLDGERIVPLRDFYLGVRRTVLRPDELLREIRFPALQPTQRGIFLKLGLRRAQAISVINVCVIADLAQAGQAPTVNTATIALGCVAPTIVRATDAEAFLRGKALTPELCAEAGRLAVSAAAPIDDLRGSAEYRRRTIAALVTQALQRLAEGSERANWPAKPVLLEAAAGKRQWAGSSTTHASAPATFKTQNAERNIIQTSINGQPFTLEHAANKTLLDALREDAGLTGTKEGCAEGECGACTVWLNGQAVMACLVPAPQAHGGDVVTIEGLAAHGEHDPARSSPLHPLQEAFITHGAVQCGYCIPGMLMAGARLLDEDPQPDTAQIQAALSGNICRCTGYRKIFAAVQDASARRTDDTPQP